MIVRAIVVVCAASLAGCAASEGLSTASIAPASPGSTAAAEKGTRAQVRPADMRIAGHTPASCRRRVVYRQAGPDADVTDPAETRRADAICGWLTAQGE